MEITLTDTLLLVTALALLMVNYATRRIAAAQASRGLVKDHLKNTRHHNHNKTLLVLRNRMSTLTSTLAFSALGASVGLVATILVLFDLNLAAKVAFVVAVAMGLMGLWQSLRDSVLSNRSHFGELDNTIAKDDPYYGIETP